MLKAFVWCALAATAGAAIVSVPIDASLLEAAGLEGKSAASGPQVAQIKGTSPIAPPKLISATDNGPERAAIRIVERVAPTPGQSPVKGVQETSRGDGRLGVAMAPRLVAPPQPAAPRGEAVGADMISRLQTELHRVGCYNGRIDGDWGPASRFAMTSFVRSVNASLPTARPDVVLLALVRAHVGRACGGQGALPARVETVEAAQPLQARLHRTDRSHSKVARVPQPARRVEAPRLQQPPRIVRDDGIAQAGVVIRRTGSDHASVIVVRPPPRSQAFNEGRMSLGAVPAERPGEAPATALTGVTRLMGDIYQGGSARSSAGIGRYYVGSRSRARRKSRRRYRRGSRTPAWASNAFRTSN